MEGDADVMKYREIRCDRWSMASRGQIVGKAKWAAVPCDDGF